MPICPRCGKTLCTNQALEYHLAKKFKCKENVCNLCKKQFNSRSSRDVHLRYCNAEKLYNSFTKWHNKDDIFVLDNTMNILKCSNALLVDSHYNCEIHSSPFSKNIITYNNQIFSVNLIYVDDCIVAIQTGIEKCSAD